MKPFSQQDMEIHHAITVMSDPHHKDVVYQAVEDLCPAIRKLYELVELNDLDFKSENGKDIIRQAQYIVRQLHGDVGENVGENL